MTQEQIELLAQRIAHGHAFDKHANEFGKISRDEFTGKILQTLMRPSDMWEMAGGRRVYWSDEEQFAVIANPRDPDGGTAFWPRDGRDYLKTLE